MSIEKQIEEQMKNAFFDLIDLNVNSDTPDFNWITNLYTEILDRLLILVEKDGKTYKHIVDTFDIELFRQMMENGVFDFESMSKLVNNVFEWILLLEAPYRNDFTNLSLKKVLESPGNKIISVFLKELHICIDNIYIDLENVKKNS